MKIVSVRLFKSSAWLGSFLTWIDSLTLLKRAQLVFFQVKLESLNLLKGPSFKASASHILWSVKFIATTTKWLKKKPFSLSSKITWSNYITREVTLIFPATFSKYHLSWVGMGRVGFSWVGLIWVELIWVEVGWVELGWLRLGWVGMGWVRLSWVEMGWVELGLVGFGWAKLGWVELGLTKNTNSKKVLLLLLYSNSSSKM